MIIIETERKRIGLYVEESLLHRCDLAIPLTDCRSRSEFMSTALEFYITHLNSEHDLRLLLPALDDSLDGRMKDQENRLSRVLFKLGVEVAMMMHVVAANNEVTEGQLAALRKLCTEEVARLSGRYSFEDAVYFQN